VGQVEGNILTLTGIVFSLQGRKKICAQAEGTFEQAQELGMRVGDDLIGQGAADFEKEWRQKYGVW
jgi:porphobilinogen deaminase